MCACLAVCVRLLTCILACLPAYMPAYLHTCLPTCMIACLPEILFGYLFGFLLAYLASSCLPPCLHGCSPSQPTCLSMFLGHAYAGVQSGAWCNCGNLYGWYGLKRNIHEACNLPCSGDASQKCGGEVANMIYPTGLPGECSEAMAS